MNDLEIGDRVRVVSESEIIKTPKNKSINGMIGTVKEKIYEHVGIEFDDYIGGHSGSWKGKDGHCWYVEKGYLEKIEDTEEEIKEEVNEEIKAETLEQKILTALREEIGVDEGEEFIAYNNGENEGVYKCEQDTLKSLYGDTFIGGSAWENWVCHFDQYAFKKKRFIPKMGENYYYLSIETNENGYIVLNTTLSMWAGTSRDYGMLALDNVFRRKEEALWRRGRLEEKLCELLKGE